MTMQSRFDIPIASIHSVLTRVYEDSDQTMTNMNKRLDALEKSIGEPTELHIWCVIDGHEEFECTDEFYEAHEAVSPSGKPDGDRQFIHTLKREYRKEARCSR